MLRSSRRRARPVVLVVDPDAIQRERVRQTLTGLLPCTILEATNKQTALAHLGATRVDLVLLARRLSHPGERAYAAAIHTDPTLRQLAGRLLATVHTPAAQGAPAVADSTGPAREPNAARDTWGATILGVLEAAM
jgi:CheY-like chemotaxis protein